MPQQVLASPKAPENPIEQRSQRERELRVRGDAGAFVALLGALQAGEAGIVRGEARNDSAAEWNARDAREHRQVSRDGARESSPNAREPREALERLAGTSHQHVDRGSPASRSGDANIDGNAPSRSQAHTPSQNATPKGDEAAKSGEPRQAQAGNASQAPQSVAASPVAAALSTVTVQSTVSGTNQTSQATAIEAARGPQGGAARGKAPAPASAHADRALRFEKVFEAQLGRGLAQALRSGDGTVTLRLRPEHLGPLSVRVHVESNQVTATFEARSVEAHRLIENSRDSLRQQLESRGLSVERIDVRLVEDASQTGTRLAMHSDGGADGGQDGRSFADDLDGRGSPDGDGTDGQSRRGAPWDDDEPAAGAEPRRALGTVRLNAIA